MTVHWDMVSTARGGHPCNFISFSGQTDRLGLGKVANTTPVEVFITEILAEAPGFGISSAVGTWECR